MRLSEYLKIGTKMKSLRKSKKISQKKMAERLNLLPSAYSNYENSISEPSVEIMQKFCEEVGCTMEELIGYDLSNCEDAHPVSTLSNLISAIMRLEKKGLPLSVTFHVKDEKMKIDFQSEVTKYDEILIELESEMEQYKSGKTSKIQFRKNVKWLIENEKNI